MGVLPNLTESIIRQYTSAQSFQRGWSYYRQGAVTSLVRRGNVLQAAVEGSQYAPYQVRVILDESGFSEAFCSCPYDWGGYCKHIVAVLLSCIHEPDQVEERAPLKEMLSALDREDLQQILLSLTRGRPGLVDEIESQVLLRQSLSPSFAQEPSPHSCLTPVDPAPFRRRVRAIIHSLDHMRPSEAYWHVAEVVGDLRQLLGQVQAFVEGGDRRSALVILEALTEEYVAEWFSLDDSDGEASGLFYDLGPVWAEAILSSDLGPEERSTWAEKLARWQGELDDYGLDEIFDAAQAALAQGWDDPTLSAIFQGRIAEGEAYERKARWYAEDLTVAQLNVLERQGRYEEYLHLAKAMGQTGHVVDMLVRLGRVQEAVEYGLQHLHTAAEALILAEALREQGAVEQALRVSEHGLSLHGPKASLAAWLRDLAAVTGGKEKALEAAVTVFRESPHLAAYLRTQELAGECWTEVRGQLLDHLLTTDNLSVKVEIYLNEGMVDEAVRAVEVSGYVGYETLEWVVDAAAASHPHWVLRRCREQAESIMDGGKSAYYHRAVWWLEKVQTAYQVAGREEEWHVYLQELLSRHRRKYRLVPMLERLK